MKIPTPDQLDTAPELAVLASLDFTLQASQFAMISSCAEIRDLETGWRSVFPEDATGIVRTMLVIMDTLSKQIGIYFEAMERQNELRGRQTNNNDF